ncbi:MAG: hypothetical protein AAFQ21_04190 [Pseudomonadota bacterium]
MSRPLAALCLIAATASPAPADGLTAETLHPLARLSDAIPSPDGEMAHYGKTPAEFAELSRPCHADKG